MEWLIFLAVVVIATLFVVWPRHGDADPGPVDVQELHAEREALLAELRELEDDALAGRITEDDRRASRRAVGVRLLHVTEALRDLGESVAPRPGGPS